MGEERTAKLHLQERRGLFVKSTQCSKEACPSEFRLDVYCAGESDEAEKERLRLQIEACEGCQLRVEQRRQGFAAFEGTEQAYLARFRNRIQEHDKARAASSEVEGSRKPGGFWLFGWKAVAGVLATAGLALFVVSSPNSSGSGNQDGASPEPTKQRGLRRKGGSGLEVFMSRDGSVEQIIDGAKLQAGDRLRFRVSLSNAQDIMVVGQEEKGHLYPVVNSAELRSISMKAGGQQLLEQTIELDASLGHEALHLVSCPSPFEFNQIEFRGKALDTPEECSINSVFFEKVSSKTP